MNQTINNRGLALYNMGRLTEGLRDFDKAIALDPDYGEAHYNRAALVLEQLERLSRETGSPEQSVVLDALASLDLAAALGPEFPELFAARGLALRLLERFSDALASYEKALGLNPDLASAQEGRALCQAGLGRAEALNIRL